MHEQEITFLTILFVFEQGIIFDFGIKNDGVQLTPNGA